MMKPRTLLHIAGILALTAGVVLVFARIDVRRCLLAFQGIRWEWVAAVALLNIVNTLVEAWRWGSIVSTVTKRTRIWSAFAGLLVGVIANVVLPFRMGESARAYFLARKESIAVPTSFSSVLLDRLADWAGFLVTALVTGALFAFPAAIRNAGLALFAGFLLAAGALLLITYLERKKSVNASPRGLRRAIRQLGGMLIDLRRTGHALRISVLTMASWFLRLLLVWMMFLAFGMNLSLVAALVVLTVVNLGIAVVNTPANIGSFELAAVAALKLLSVDQDLAISYTIVLHLAEVVPVALLGLAVLWTSGWKLGKMPGPEVEEVLGPGAKRKTA